MSFLLKQTSSHDLSQAIREVQNGNTFFSHSVGMRLHDQRVSVRGSRALRKTVARLSARELAVLQLLAGGKSNKGTGTKLGISTKTVEKHRQNLMAKLNIHEISGLTRYAIGAGIVECSVELTIR